MQTYVADNRQIQLCRDANETGISGNAQRTTEKFDRFRWAKATELMENDNMANAFKR
jgi:hypothetical protein